jgi:hypothetical protein
MADIDIRDRTYLSQYGTETLGLAIQLAGVPTDVDAAMTLTMTDESTNGVVFTRAATRVSLGTYQTVTSSTETAIPGNFTLTWTYALAGNPQTYSTYVVIGPAVPDYDVLNADMKAIVEITMHRFADLFDSPGGGPNLTTYFQTHFNRGRMAQLLRIAVGTMNTIAQPFMTYTVDGVGGALFPTAQWGPLLERMLYVEAVKHLIRSYVEQAQFVGGNVTRLDRRDYMDRWRTVLADEEVTLKSQLDIFKISNMGLGQANVLVSGGAFGRYAPTRIAGSAAARPRMWSRFYA